MDGGSGCRKQGPPNSFDRPPGSHLTWWLLCSGWCQWFSIFGGVRWMVCVWVNLDGLWAHCVPLLLLRVRVFVSGFVGVWGRLAALLVLCALLSVVLAVAGPSADAQADWSQIGVDIDGESE